MLSDPLVLKVPNLASHTTLTSVESLSLARVSEAGGKAVYGPASNADSMLVTLTISHSESSENKPVKTKRALVRIDVQGFLADERRGSAFAYIVVGLPEGNLYARVGDIATNDSPLTAEKILEILIAAVATSNSAFTLDETKITRITAGES